MIHFGSDEVLHHIHPIRFTKFTPLPFKSALIFVLYKLCEDGDSGNNILDGALTEEGYTIKRMWPRWLDLLILPLTVIP